MQTLANIFQTFVIPSKYTVSVSLITVLGASLFLVLPNANAASIVLTPPKFEQNVNPGETLYKTVKIKNNGPRQIPLQASVEDFAPAKDEGGQPRFLKDSKADASITMSKWVSFEKEIFVVKPQQTLEVPFKIEIPQNAEPGGHYGTIFFAPPSQDGGNVSIQQRIGSLLLLRVSGEIHEEGSLQTFGTYKQDANFVESNPEMHSFYQSLPVNFTTRFENSGNVHLKPKGKIYIENFFGERLQNIWREVQVNDQGLVVSSRQVDYIPVNDTQGNVLPKSIRKFETMWENQNDKFHFGPYTATLELSYGNGQETTPQTTSFWILPWKLIALWTLGIIVFIGIGYLIIKAYRKRVEEKIRMQMELEELRKQTSNNK